MDETTAVDLSDFYQHPLEYGDYVALAYGFTMLILVSLVVIVLMKRRRMRSTLRSLEGL